MGETRATSDYERILDGRSLSRQLATQHLFSYISHDMRKGLQACVRTVDLLEQRLRDHSDSGVSALVESLRDDLHHVESRLGTAYDLLGKRQKNVLPASVHEAVRYTAELLGDAFKMRRCRLDLRLEAAADSSFVPAAALVEIISSLLLNSLDASASGVIVSTTSAVDVEIPSMGSIKGIQLDVHDNGLGVPDELKERLFEFGVTGRHGRSGLGLALARSLTLEAGGELYLHGASRPHDTRFVLVLPTA